MPPSLHVLDSSSKSPFDLRSGKGFGDCTIRGGRCEDIDGIHEVVDHQGKVKSIRGRHGKGVGIGKGNAREVENSAGT